MFRSGQLQCLLLGVIVCSSVLINPVIAEHVPANWDDMEMHKWYEPAELAPKVGQLDIDPFVPGRMFGFAHEQKVGSVDYYLAYSLDSGKTWTDLDQSFEQSHGNLPMDFQVLFRNDDDPVFFLGVDEHDSPYSTYCLYKRDGLNGNWGLVKEFAEPDTHIHGLCLSVGSDGIILLALSVANFEGSYNEFVRSADHGVTWNSVWIQEGSSMVHGFSYSPHNSNEVLACSAIRHNQLLRSLDGGNSWENLNFNVATLPQDGITNAVFHPDNPEVYFVIMGEFSVEVPSCIQISLDRGQTWSDFGPYNEEEKLSISDLYIDPVDNDFMVCAGQSLDAYHGPDVWVSRDGGNNWEGKLDYYSEGNNLPVRLFDSPWESECLYLSSQHLFKSEDRGETWSLTKPSDSSDPPSVYFDKTRMGYALLFHDGLGCFWSKDRCQTWHPSIIHHITRSFNHVTPTRDCENPDILYMTAYPQFEAEYPNMIYKSEDFGCNWYPMLLPDQTSGWHVTASKHKAGVLYVLAGTEYDAAPNAYVSYDYASSWNKLSLPEGYIYHDISDQYIQSSVIYAVGTHTSTGESHFFRSMDGGTVWQKIGSEYGYDGLGGTRTSRGSITLHPVEPDHIFLGSGYYYESRNGGLTWERTAWGSSFKNTHYLHPDFPAIEITPVRFTRDGRITYSDSEAISGRSGIFMFRHCKDFLLNDSIMRIDDIGPSIQMAGYGRTNLKKGETSNLEIYAYAVDPSANDAVEHLELCLDGYPAGYRIESKDMLTDGFFVFTLPVSPTFPWAGILQLRAMDTNGNLGSSWPEYSQ